MATNNTYQIAAVRTDLIFGTYEFLSEPIHTFRSAIKALDQLRAKLLAEGKNPSIVWRHHFICGPIVYRLYKHTKLNPPRPLGISR